MEVEFRIFLNYVQCQIFSICLIRWTISRKDINLVVVVHCVPYVRHSKFPFGHHLMDINNGPSSSRKGYDVGLPSNILYRNKIFRVFLQYENIIVSVLQCLNALTLIFVFLDILMKLLSVFR